MGEIAPYAPLKSGFLKNKGGYLDDTISVQIKTTRAYDTKVFLTYVQIADPTQLRTAPAQANTFNPDKYRSKKIVNADIIAKRCKAVLAINGDYFIDRKEGCIVRNGVRLRSADFGVFDCLIIDTNGDFHILKTPTEAEFDAFEGEVMHSFSFGPGLVIDGEAQTDYNAGTMGGTSKKAQRQVICQMDKLSYLIVTTHGPEQSGSEGMSLKQKKDDQKSNSDNVSMLLLNFLLTKHPTQEDAIKLVPHNNQTKRTLHSRSMWTKILPPYSITKYRLILSLVFHH